jgi:hypothetical protein
MSDEIDRLTFWRGWWEGARGYPDEQRLKIYDAILAYAFEGAEPPEPDGDLSAAIVYQAVATVRPTIAISRKRREIGATGGSVSKRKQSASKAQAKRKQDGSKAQARRKQSQAKPNQEQVQEQVQVQEQEQEHIAICSTATARRRGKQMPTIEQFVDGGKVAGVPEDFARRFYGELVAAGWQDADGVYVANWRRYLKSAWVAEQKKISAARVSDEAFDAIKIGR